MKVNIILEEDKELRDEVKNLISGQVKSLTREYVMEVIENSTKPYPIRSLVGDEVRKRIDDALRHTSMDILVKQVVREIIQDEVLSKLVLPKSISIEVQPLVKTD